MSSAIQRAGKGLANASNRRLSAGKGLANASNRRPSAGKGLANASNRRPSAGKGLANASNRRPSAVGFFPATFRLSFGPVTSDTVAIDLTKILSSVVKSFNIWCSEENEHIFSKGPVSSFLTDRPKRVFISKLRPGTMYTFRAVAYGDTAEVGYAQAMCSTKPVDTNHESSNPPAPSNFGMQIQIQQGNCSNAGVEQIQQGDCSNAGVEQIQQGNCSSAGVEQIQQGNCSSAGVERDRGRAEEAVREMHSPPTTHGRSLDLNHGVSVPDLNEDDGPVPDLNDDGGPVPDLNKDGGPVPDLNEDGGPLPNLNVDNDRAEVPHTADANSVVVDKPLSGGFEGKFGECVKTIGRLERNGHLETEFGMKFLTWFTQRSTSEQKLTVSLFIEALGDDEERLAKQLVDTYSHKINKRLKQ